MEDPAGGTAGRAPEAQADMSSSASVTTPAAAGSESAAVSIYEPEPQSYRIERRMLEGLGMAPASARTSFTRVNDTRPASLSEVDATGEGVDPAQEPQGAEPESEQEEAEAVPQTPRASVTFLLVSGRRRTMLFEPETTIGRVKELVWNAWPNDRGASAKFEDSEWQDERPPAPSYLRILHLGKILQDDDTLTKLNFPVAIVSSPSTTPLNQSSPPPTTIVHLSIRPYAQTSDDEALKKKGKRRRRDGQPGGEGVEDGTGGGCCGCVVC